jgi:uncharacterized lipoprotein YajG
MKKILFLMSAMLVLTLCSFSQQVNLYETIKPYTTPPQNIYNGSIKKSIESENLKTSTSEFLPGDYLIKARNQIFTGVGLQILSVAFVLVSSDSYSKRITDARSQQEINDLDKNKNMCYVGAGVLSLIGFGFELSGIGNIGKAGLSMNENGIGVKVKF